MIWLHIKRGFQGSWELSRYPWLMEVLIGMEKGKRSMAAGRIEEHYLKSQMVERRGVSMRNVGTWGASWWERTEGFLFVWVATGLARSTQECCCPRFIGWCPEMLGEVLIGGQSSRAVCCVHGSIWGEFIASVLGLPPQCSCLSRSEPGPQEGPCWSGSPRSAISATQFLTLNVWGRLKLRCLYYCRFKMFYYDILQTHLKIWETILTKPSVVYTPPNFIHLYILTYLFQT